MPWLARDVHFGRLCSLIERLQLVERGWTVQQLIDRIDEHTRGGRIHVADPGDQRHPLGYLAWLLRSAVPTTELAPFERVARERRERVAAAHAALAADAARRAQIDAESDAIEATIAGSVSEASEDTTRIRLTIHPERIGKRTEAARLPLSCCPHHASAIAAQSVAGLSQDEAQRRRALSSGAALIFGRSKDPEDVVAFAGTVMRLEASGAATGEELRSARAQHTYVIPPDDVRRAAVGQFWVVQGGAIAPFRALPSPTPPTASQSTSEVALGPTATTEDEG